MGVPNIFMLTYFRFLFLFFLITGYACKAQSLRYTEDEKKLLNNINQANSETRIRLMSLYCDENIYFAGKKNQEQFNILFAKCYQIAKRDKDKEFENYLDFFKRTSGIIFITEQDNDIRISKILKIWQKALDYYQSQKNDHFVAICRVNVGHYLFMQKEFAKSLEELLLADELFKKIGYEKFPEMGKLLHNMSLVFYFFRQYDKVVNLMEISAKLPEYDNNRRIQLYNTLGSAYKNLKNFDKAKAAYLKTRKTAIEYKDNFWIAFASQNLANLYLDNGKYKEALQEYKSNLKYIEAYKQINRREYYDYLLGMAKSYIWLKDFSNAKKYLDIIDEKPMTNAREQKFIFGVAYQDINYWLNFYEVEEKYYKSVKNYNKAYHYLDSLYYIKYKKDSLFNGLQVQVVQDRIDAKDKQYQNDKKEVTIKSKNQQILFIAILLTVITIATISIIRRNRKINSQNKIISKQLGELTKTLEQKQVLLSELQHRVKNNLQHVISILEIQKESVDFNNIDELIRGNQNRIHSMALLHKKLNVSDHTKEVDLKKYITELSELVKESYDNHKKRVSLHIQCDIDKISIEKALPLGLIITELVSNSMKHAFKKRSVGIINIEITKDEFLNQKKLYYCDNGDGFDFNKTSEKGLGQEIIKGLIDQLDGKTEAKSSNGFELSIFFN